MKRISMKYDVTLHLSNIDLKVLLQTSEAWGMTIERAISSILQEWVNEHVGSRSK